MEVLLFCFFKIYFILQGGFRFTEQLRGMYRNFLYTPSPTHAWPPPLSASPTRVIHLLQLMIIHQNVIIIQSLYLHQGSLLVLYILWAWTNV